MSEPIFVASPVEVYQGEAAVEHLQTTNDSQYASEDGVMVVSDTRWLKAQEYERQTWMQYNPQATQDRNSEHAGHFDQYRALPEKLGDVVELGCGPFTNARYVLQGNRWIHTITLVDPLLNTYLGHPHCAYTDHAALGITLINNTIEDWQPAQQYDTAIMVNVIAHCRNGYKVLDKLWDILKPGGMVVFHENPREYDPLQHYDVGHPIAPKASVLEAFIGRFEPLYRNGWYFIGRKPVEPVTITVEVTEEPARPKPRSTRKNKA